MIRLLPILICSLILILNWFIFYSTSNKINHYKHFPPFSVSGSNSSKDAIFNLIDGDHTTYWKKERDGKEWDFELELRFNYRIVNNIYIPIHYKQLSILPCESYPEESLILEFFQKEGINVDRELRLPEIFVLKNIQIDNLKAPLLIEISEFQKKFKELDRYDGKQMFIYGVRGRLKAKQGKGCLAEISLIQ